jgi:hypothetical protein
MIRTQVLVLGIATPRRTFQITEVTENTAASIFTASQPRKPRLEFARLSFTESVYFLNTFF